MADETNRLIEEFQNEKLDPDMGIRWWNKERIKKIKKIVKHLEGLGGYKEGQLKELKIGELEDFLKRLIMAYEKQDDEELKEWSRRLDQIGTVKAINQRLDMIINFLKAHISKAEIEDPLELVHNLLGEIKAHPGSKAGSYLPGGGAGIPN